MPNDKLLIMPCPHFQLTCQLVLIKSCSLISYKAIVRNHIQALHLLHRCVIRQGPTFNTSFDAHLLKTLPLYWSHQCYLMLTCPVHEALDVAGDVVETQGLYACGRDQVPLTEPKTVLRNLQVLTAGGVVTAIWQRQVKLIYIANTLYHNHILNAIAMGKKLTNTWSTGQYLGVVCLTLVHALEVPSHTSLHTAVCHIDLLAAVWK